MPETKVPTLDALEKTIGKAIADAKHLSKNEADVRVGALIVPTYWLEENDKDVDEKDKKTGILLALLRKFGSDNTVQFCWEVYPGGVHCGTTFFYFTKVP